MNPNIINTKCYCLFQFQDQLTGCPAGFPNLEVHQGEDQHGDVCRNKKGGGFYVGWACPKECEVTQSLVAPYCRMSRSNDAACRVNKGILYYCKYTK